MSLLLFLIIFAFGLEFGSFANVCIYRWPREKSIVRPLRSHCPKCNHKISWWENIPVFSFLFLKGKCSKCHTSISWRYPLVELLLPTLWVGAYYFARLHSIEGSIPFWIMVFSFIFVLLVTTFTDLDFKLIPDNATFFLIAVGLIFSPWNIFLMEPGPSQLHPFFYALFGVLVGGGILWLTAILGEFIFKKEALGGGDIKLVAGVGAIFGWEGALLTIFIGSIMGTLVGLGGLASGSIKRQQYIPFGPFLNFGALVTYLWFCRQMLVVTF